MRKTKSNFMKMEAAMKCPVFIDVTRRAHSSLIWIDLVNTFLLLFSRLVERQFWSIP